MKQKKSKCKYCSKNKSRIIIVKDFDLFDKEKVKLIFCDKFCAMSYAVDKKIKLITKGDNSFKFILSKEQLEKRIKNYENLIRKFKNKIIATQSKLSNENIFLKDLKRKHKTLKSKFRDLYIR